MNGKLAELVASNMFVQEKFALRKEAGKNPHRNKMNQVSCMEITNEKFGNEEVWCTLIYHQTICKNKSNFFSAWEGGNGTQCKREPNEQR